MNRRKLLASIPLVWTSPIITHVLLPAHAQTSVNTTPDPQATPDPTPPMPDFTISACDPVSDPDAIDSAGTGATSGFVLTSMGTDGTMAYFRIINRDNINTLCYNMSVSAVSGANAGDTKEVYVCPADFNNRFGDSNVVIVAFDFSGNTADTYALFNDQGTRLDQRAVGTATFGGSGGPLVCFS